MCIARRLLKSSYNPGEAEQKGHRCPCVLGLMAFSSFGSKPKVLKLCSLFGQAGQIQSSGFSAKQAQAWVVDYRVEATW